MHQENKNSFEQFIIKCCKSKEWDLRKFLKNKLLKAGFSIQEDNYLSSRCHKNSKYNKVHNMLAIRGEPKICLVAHTDVCRDHSWGNKIEPDVFPVLKNWGTEDEPRIIIQDKDCSYQTGGDDRLGVAINTWLALNTGYDLGLLFTTDEEIGLISASECTIDDLQKFELLVQVDRGNHTNQLVSHIGGTTLCSDKTTKRLLKIAEDMGRARVEVGGMATDVLCIIRNDMAKEAINMTCGYHNSIGDSSKEYIDVEEARSTMKYVGEIIKYYDLDYKKNEIETNDIIEKEIINKEIDNMKDYVKIISYKEKNYKKVKRGKSRKYYEEN